MNKRRKKKINMLRKPKKKGMANIFLGNSRQISMKNKALNEALLAYKMARV